MKSAYNSIDSLIAKLKLLGQQPKLVDTNYIVSTLGHKKKLMVVKEDLVLESMLFNDIKHLEGTPYSIVTHNNKYGLIKEVQSIEDVPKYVGLERWVKVSDTVYNIVAKLDYNVYGVIDTDENEIIPLNHYYIQVYEIQGRIVYIGYILDSVLVYDEQGKLLKVTKKINTNNIKVSKDYIICKYPRAGSIFCTHIFYNLEGEEIYRFNDSVIKRDYKGNIYIIDRNFNVLIDNIEQSIEI